jgi:capsular exopolysaccharide synthesis family protein
MLERAPWLAGSGQREIGREGGQFISHADIFAFVRRYAGTIAACVLTGIGVAGAYLVTAEPIFTARSQLLIDPKMPQFLLEQRSEVNFSLDTAQVESQIAVLRSERIITSVIEKLNLTEDPEFQGRGTSPLKTLTAALPEWLQSQSLLEWFGSADEDIVLSDPVLSDFERLRRAIGTFDRGLTVKRLGFSYAIEIAFSSRDPEKAAAIVNAVTDTYIRDQLETQAQAARQGSDWLEERIKKIRAQMNAATHMAQEFRARHDYRIGRRRDPSAEPEPAADPGKAAREEYTLEELETTAETYRKMYESFLQAFTASVHRQSFPVSDARVITPATRPLAKSYPRTKLVLALGAMMGMMLGCAIAVVRHGLDRSVRSSRQIRDELGIECLGELPRIKSRHGGRRGLGGRLSRRGAHAAAHFDEVTRLPFSQFSDGLKSVKAAITLANAAQPVRCIGVTSSMPREGKSTVASNLAALFSRSGSRTLVIDADTYKSTLTKHFAPEATTGLIEAVEDPTQAKRGIVPAKGGGFDLLPAANGPMANSADILGSAKMRALLQDLLQSYDIIVVDLPPLKSVVDGLAISPLLDGVVLVGEWAATPIDLLSEMSRSLRSAKATLLGVVMTKVEGEARPTYGSRRDAA